MRRPYDRKAIHLDAMTAWAEAADSADENSAKFATAEAQAIELATGNADSGARAIKWVRTLYSYELHWSRNGHAPRENTRNRAALPDWERRMGEWARYQRRFERQLSVYQRIRLDRSPAFEWDPNEAAWDRTLNEAIRFVVTHDRLPYLNRSDPAEFATARWLARQLRQHKTGLLTQRRATLIDALLTLARQRNT